MNITQCYAPNNDYNEDDKDQFYDRLQSVIEKCPTKDLTILMGDFNAKVGTDNTGYEDIMGRHGLEERNENGERFANLCAFNKLVIGGTIFPHKRTHKTTWTSQDHTTQNQIDHICINKKFRRTMEDVRTNRGADIASDHHLLVAKMKLELKKHWTTGRTTSQKLNTTVLQDTDKLNKFKIVLSNRFQMNITQCYAPNNDYNEDDKDQFYDRLQSVIEKCPTKDLTILMGDFNAKVGTDNTGYEDIMGRHGLEERNENGERFANLCAFNKLVIGGTIFPHKRTHKTTWTSQDHTTQNQIDHICINKKFRRTMEDVRTNRGADIASDHHLLVAKMKLELKKHWTTGRTTSQKLNTTVLQDTDKLNKFKIVLSNRFQ
ncbi:unnamed protein product, partial [Schistosoma margrebowiei]